MSENQNKEQTTEENESEQNSEDKSSNDDGGKQLKDILDVNYYIIASPAYDGDAPRHLARLAELGHAAGLPLVASNDVYLHVPERRPLLRSPAMSGPGCR